jgi:exosortase/archaeosortase family protein
MSFEVSLACSGSGFLMEGLAIAVLLGELEQASVGRRLRLIAAMVIVALVTNWLRVLALIDIGYSTAMRHLLVTDYHVMFGYVLFVLVLSAFVWIAAAGARSSVPPVARSAVSPPSRSRDDAFLPALLGLAAAPVLTGVLMLFGGDHSQLRAGHAVKAAMTGTGPPATGPKMTPVPGTLVVSSADA